MEIDNGKNEAQVICLICLCLLHIHILTWTPTQDFTAKARQSSHKDSSLKIQLILARWIAVCKTPILDIYILGTSIWLQLTTTGIVYPDWQPWLQNPLKKDARENLSLINSTCCNLVLPQTLTPSAQNTWKSCQWEVKTSFQDYGEALSHVFRLTKVEAVDAVMSTMMRAVARLP